MARISTYEVVPVPKLADRLIGTSVGGEIEDITYNFTLSELLNLFLPNIPANNLQGVLDYGNTATQDIVLYGTMHSTNLDVTNTLSLFDSYLNGDTHILGALYDVNDSKGIVAQVLTSTGDNVEWITLPPIFTPDLQQVLTTGNTSNVDIILNANIQSLDVNTDTETVNDNITIDGTITDGYSSVGTSNKVLSSTGTQVKWVSLPSYTATSPLFLDNITKVFSIQQANGTQSGYLSVGDWITFDGKQSAGNYITALTGEATATGPGSVNITLTNSAVTGKVLTGLSISSGAVTSTDSILTAFGKVQSQINGLIGGVVFKGTWNAFTNVPTLISSVGTQGWYYIVDVAGNTNLNGITDWQVGDWAIFNGSTWNKVDNTDVGITSLNGLTTNTQYFSVGTSGTDFAISSLVDTHTFNLPTASASNRGALSSADWTTFNSKESALTFSSPLVRTTNTISIPVATTSVNGYLSSTDWTTFNNKANALSGTINTITYWDSATTIASLALSTYPSLTELSYVKGVTSAIQTQLNAKQATITLTTTGTSGAATFVSNTLNIPQYQSALTNPITGTGTSGQIAYWNGTSTQTGSATLTFTPTSAFLLNNTVTASAGVAQGKSQTSTLIAAANSDFLVGLDVNPTFTNGAFTTVANIGIRSQVSSATGKWNIYSSGTASNYFNGNVVIGSTTDSGFKLQVTGTTSLTGAVTFGVASTNNRINGNLDFGNNLVTAYIQQNGSAARSLRIPGTAGNSPWLFTNSASGNGVNGTFADGSFYMPGNYLGITTATFLPVGSIIIQFIGAKGTQAASNRNIYIGDGANYSVSEKGYNVRILSGYGGTNLNGGDIFLTPAIPNGTGLSGNVILNNDGTTTYGKTGIGTASPNVSSILDITSTTLGFLQPRMTTTQRNAIATPATGLQVYNTTTNTNDTYNGTAWVSGGGAISGTSGQVAYFNGTNSITSNAAFAFTPTSQLLVNNSVTAASAIARGTNFTPTLTAAANGDVLVGLDISPTFTNGAFTSVANYALKVLGNSSFTSSIASGTSNQFTTTQTTANSSDLLDGAFGIDYTFNAATGTELVTRAMNFRTFNTGAAPITNMRAWNVGSSTSTGSTVTNLDQLYIEKGATTLGTVTNNRAIYIPNLQGTNQAGLVIGPISAAGNSSAIIISSTGGTIPIGTWGIYNSVSSANYLQGNLLLGTTTDNGDKLQVAGNLSLTTAGNKIKIAVGTNAAAGSGALVAGVLVVNTTALTSQSGILITNQGIGTLVGTVKITARTGSSFTITSTVLTDNDIIAWIIIN